MYNEKYEIAESCADQACSDGFLLYARDLTGSTAFYLRNTMCPPYKRPRLPIRGSAAKVHHLLRALKIAHALLVKHAVQLTASLPESLLRMDEIYKVDLLYPDHDCQLDYCDQGRMWFDDGCPFPCAVSGFRIVGLDKRYFDYSFDLSPITAGTPAFFDLGVSDEFLNTWAAAANFYNESVELLLQENIAVVPHKFADALFFLYPQQPLPGSAHPLNI